MEKEQGENIWRREIFFAEKNKKGEGKYLGKENIHLRRKKNIEGREENVWRRKHSCGTGGRTDGSKAR